VQGRNSGRNKILRFLSAQNTELFAPIITKGIMIKQAELTRIFLESVTGGTAKALSETGSQNAMVSKAEAYRLYGRSQVDRWISEGLFKPLKGQIYISKSGIDREKLEAIAAASNRGTYLPVSDR